MLNKKLAASLAAIVLMLGGTATALAIGRDQQPTKVVAAAGTYGAFNYSSVTGGVAITSYSGSGGAVDIPSKINGANVVAIANNAFFQCDTVTSVKIPNTVKKIGDNAFFYCTSMTSVTIPDSVTEIGVCAFSGCSSLGSVKLPSSLKTVKEAAFSDCTSLISVTIPDTKAAFRYETFIGCTSLKSVTVPFKVDSIDDAAFGFSVVGDDMASYSKISGFKLKCYMNSKAYVYAVESGISYEILDPETPDKIYGVEDETPETPPTPASPAVPDEPEYPDDDTTSDENAVPGDINGDGSVNVNDITLVSGHVKGTQRLSSKAAKSADVNGDSRVDITDVTMIAAQVKGLQRLS